MKAILVVVTLLLAGVAKAEDRQLMMQSPSYLLVVLEGLAKPFISDHGQYAAGDVVTVDAELLPHLWACTNQTFVEVECVRPAEGQDQGKPAFLYGGVQ